MQRVFLHQILMLQYFAMWNRERAKTEGVPKSWAVWIKGYS
jgi:hypothetical protein